MESVVQPEAFMFATIGLNENTVPYLSIFVTIPLTSIDLPLFQNSSNFYGEFEMFTHNILLYLFFVIFIKQ